MKTLCIIILVMFYKSASSQEALHLWTFEKPIETAPWKQGLSSSPDSKLLLVLSSTDTLLVISANSGVLVKSISFNALFREIIKKYQLDTGKVFASKAVKLYNDKVEVIYVVENDQNNCNLYSCNYSIASSLLYIQKNNISYQWTKGVFFQGITSDSIAVFVGQRDDNTHSGSNYKDLELFIECYDFKSQKTFVEHSKTIYQNVDTYFTEYFSNIRGISEKGNHTFVSPFYIQRISPDSLFIQNVYTSRIQTAGNFAINNGEISEDTNWLMLPHFRVHIPSLLNGKFSTYPIFDYNFSINTKNIYYSIGTNDAFSIPIDTTKLYIYNTIDTLSTTKKTISNISFNSGKWHYGDINYQNRMLLIQDDSILIIQDYDKLSAYRIPQITSPIVKPPFTYKTESPDRDSCYFTTKDTVRLINTTMLYDNNVTWFWSFGDGSTSNARDAKHSYDNEGTYIITMWYIDIDGDTVRGRDFSIHIKNIVSTSFSVTSNDFVVDAGGHTTLKFAIKLSNNGCFRSNILMKIILFNVNDTIPIFNFIDRTFRSVTLNDSITVSLYEKGWYSAKLLMYQEVSKGNLVLYDSVLLTKIVECRFTPAPDIKVYTFYRIDQSLNYQLPTNIFITKDNQVLLYHRDKNYITDISTIDFQKTFSNYTTPERISKLNPKRVFTIQQYNNSFELFFETDTGYISIYTDDINITDIKNLRYGHLLYSPSTYCPPKFNLLVNRSFEFKHKFDFAFSLDVEGYWYDWKTNRDICYYINTKNVFARISDTDTTIIGSQIFFPYPEYTEAIFKNKVLFVGNNVYKIPMYSKYLVKYNNILPQTNTYDSVFISTLQCYYSPMLLDYRTKTIVRADGRYNANNKIQEFDLCNYNNLYLFPDGHNILLYANYYHYDTHQDSLMVIRIFDTDIKQFTFEKQFSHSIVCCAIHPCSEYFLVMEESGLITKWETPTQIERVCDPNVKTDILVPKGSMFLSPNPSTNYFTATINQETEAPVELLIYDTRGLSSSVYYNPKESVGIHQIEIDMRPFANGAYYLVYKSNTLTTSSMFIKLDE
ncbi:MAG: PKD domain-containing protein [Bacteriodetes bacterium]|nr:PKD domain-containing protein [Bacteroidota bacterium]